MNKNFVILPIGKIVVLKGKYTTSYFKEINNKLYILTAEELKYVQNIFNKKDDLYYSEHLTNLINENAVINKIPNINTFLLYVENLIPSNYRNDFYHSLATLKINFNKDNVPETKRGFYRFEDNSITIYTKKFIDDQNKNKSDSLAVEKINIIFYKTLLHELLHMASTKNINNQIISGFDNVLSDLEAEKNRGITEGLTEFITIKAFPNGCAYDTSYYMECAFAAQLIEIIGLEPVLSAYFSGQGIEPLKAELNKIIPDDMVSNYLFRMIEDNFNLRNTNYPQSFAGDIQECLINYYKEKVNKAVKNHTMTKEEVLAGINNYASALVTKETILNHGADYRIYPTIEYSLSLYEELKDKYTHSKKHMV
jgi:hypothetical protein